MDTASECPAGVDITMCFCVPLQRTMIHSADASFYPKAGLFRVGKTLYNARSAVNFFGRHAWEAIIGNSAAIGKRRVFHLSGTHVYALNLRLVCGTGMTVFFEPAINGKSLPSVYVRRIQRAVRCFLWRGFESHRLALMMGLHTRLGVASCLADVPSELLRIIWSYHV